MDVLNWIIENKDSIYVSSITGIITSYFVSCIFKRIDEHKYIIDSAKELFRYSCEIETKLLILIDCLAVRLSTAEHIYKLSLNYNNNNERSNFIGNEINKYKKNEIIIYEINNLIIKSNSINIDKKTKNKHILNLHKTLCYMECCKSTIYEIGDLIDKEIINFNEYYNNNEFKFKFILNTNIAITNEYSPTIDKIQNLKENLHKDNFHLAKYIKY